jgi:hypothetical protein
VSGPFPAWEEIQMSIRFLRTLAAVGAVLALTTAVGVRAQQNPIPETFTNLQVLPKDITRAQLVPIMRSFSIQLDVPCEHCHLGEGRDLSKFDFASDVRPAKATARKMMALVSAINGPLLEGVGEPAAPGAPKVTCFTCHRGARVPLTAPPPVK